MPVTITREEGRGLLVRHLGLAKTLGNGTRGVRAVLEKLRVIQLDPLDLIGANADLVVLARVDGAVRGDVWRDLFPRRAFEHFAKERCILPADTFPWYRQQGHRAQAPWWSHGEREMRVPKTLVEAVLAEVRERGPVTAKGLTDHGRVEPLDWSGWKGTARATSMALEILWTRCDIVVAGRTESGAKLYDVPENVFGAELAGQQPVGDFARWAVHERTHAAGLLTRAAGGSLWSMLRDVRGSGVVDSMIEDGELVEVQIEASPRRYLAIPELLRTRRIAYDDRVRILGPLDPLLWDRDLVRHLFEFDYVWEVYKPAAQRKWGWYVCPLLHRDRFVGRIDARVTDGVLVVAKLWLERDVDRAAVVASLERHALACAASRVRLPRKWPSRLP
jgi:uncharacterized protein YcaQ